RRWARRGRGRWAWRRRLAHWRRRRTRRRGRRRTRRRWRTYRRRRWADRRRWRTYRRRRGARGWWRRRRGARWRRWHARRLRLIYLTVTTPGARDERPVDLSVREINMRSRRQHIPKNTNPRKRHIRRLREVQDNIILRRAVQMIAHVLHRRRRAGD